MTIRILFATLLATVSAGCGYHEEKGKVAISVKPTFSSIQTVIVNPKCIRCHSGAAAPNGIDLTNYTALMRGGTSGTLIVRGNPDESKFYQVIRSGTMPKGGPPLSDPEIKAVYDWIESGAGEQES